MTKSFQKVSIMQSKNFQKVSKTFKKVTGLTPTQYRKSNTENYYKRDTDPHQKEKM